MKLLVDDKEIEVKEGTTLLRACLDNDIYIPNLCYLEEMAEPPVSCRMCFVEIVGEDKPVASCAVKIENGMVVKTDTPAVRRLQRSAFQLFLSVHRVECGRCPANKKCALQHIARFLKVGLKTNRLERYLKGRDLEDGHPFFNYYPNRCILCGKCVYVCRKQHERSHLSFARRGMDTEITFFGENDDSTMPCENCLACVDVCPVDAIILKSKSYQTDQAKK